MQELVSIIIPVYKVEVFLERCVYSVMAQTYQKLEIILVDDGSPDSCGDICEKLAGKDERISVYHKPNGGLSDARNYGVARSCGKYICFIDSDDFVAPNYVEYLLNLMNKHDADISCCCMVKTETDTAAFCENKDLPAELVLTGKKACKRLVGDLDNVLVTAWGKLYKSEIVKMYPFPYGKKHEDEATTCKYYYESQTVAIGNQCLYAYYQNPQGIMRTLGTALNLDIIWALEHKARFFEEKNEIKISKYAWRILYYYYLADSRAHNGRCDELIEKLDERKLPFINMLPLFIKRHAPRLYSCYRKTKGFVRKVFFKK